MGRRVCLFGGSMYAVHRQGAAAPPPQRQTPPPQRQTSHCNKQHYNTTSYIGLCKPHFCTTYLILTNDHTPCHKTQRGVLYTVYLMEGTMVKSRPGPLQLQSLHIRNVYYACLQFLPSRMYIVHTCHSSMCLSCIQVCTCQTSLYLSNKYVLVRQATMVKIRPSPMHGILASISPHSLLPQSPGQINKFVFVPHFAQK